MTTGRQYARLRMDIWRDDEWRALSADAQWLYELLISQPTINSAGVLALQITKWTRYAAGMTGERIVAALGLLIERNYIVVDDDTEEVLVRSFIRHDVVACGGSPKIMLSALRTAGLVQSEDLRTVLLEEIQRLGRDWSENHKVLIKALQDSLSIAFRKPFDSHSIAPVEVQVSSEVGFTNFTSPGLGKSGTSPARAEEESRPRDRMGRPAMSFTAMAGGAEVRPEPPPPDRHIPPEANTLIPACVTSRKIRERLRVEIGELLNDGAGREDLEQAMDRYVSRLAGGEDVYPGSVKHLLQQVVAQRTITAQQLRNGRPPGKGERRLANIQALKSDNPARKEITNGDGP